MRASFRVILKADVPAAIVLLSSRPRRALVLPLIGPASGAWIAK